MGWLSKLFPFFKSNDEQISIELNPSSEYGLAILDIVCKGKGMRIDYCMSFDARSLNKKEPYPVTYFYGGTSLQKVDGELMAYLIECGDTLGAKQEVLKVFRSMVKDKK